MSPAHRAYVRRETLVAVAINSALSLAFTLLAAHGRASIPLWGADGMALDLVPQLFMMTFATTLAVTLLTRQRVRKGVVAPLGGEGAGAPFDWAPRNALLRAVLFGAAAVLALAPPSVAVLAFAGVRAAPLGPYLLAKLVYGAGMSLLIGPLVTLAALSLRTTGRPPLAGKPA